MGSRTDSSFEESRGFEEEDGCKHVHIVSVPLIRSTGIIREQGQANTHCRQPRLLHALWGKHGQNAAMTIFSSQRA